MSKYARMIPIDGQHRVVDVVDTSVYEPRPEWGQTDEQLLGRIFAPNKDAWVEAGQWFVLVPLGVQNGAVHTGGDFMDPATYLNPDGSNGDGVMPDDQA